MLSLLTIIAFIIIAAIVGYMHGSTRRQLDEAQEEITSALTPEPAPLTWEQEELKRQSLAVFDMATFFAIENRTYNGPLPEHIAGHHYTDMYPNIYVFSVAGINKRKGIRKYAGMHFNCQLIPDPGNRYDKNAIKVLHAEDDIHLGFVPADETDSLREFLQGQIPATALIKIVEREDYDDYNERTGEYRTYLYGEVAVHRPCTPTLSLATGEPLHPQFTE